MKWNIFEACFGIWNNYISNQRILDLYLMVYVLKEMETASLNITH